MSDDSEKKIEELKKKLSATEHELERYKSEIGRLNVQLKQLIDQINHEIKTSGMLQKALVPTEIPSIPGFEFSTKFIASLVSGGDYFDLFEHDDKFRFGLVLSSASGYGMSALFLSVLMKLASRAETRKGSTTSAALETILQEITPSMVEQDTAEVFYGIVDRRTFEMSYTLAGDICVVHQSVDGKITIIEPTNSGISLHSKEPFQVGKLALNAKDRVGLFSKGVFKSLDAKNREFGREKVEKAFVKTKGDSVHELRNEILFQVEQHTGKTEPDRDLTVVVFEIKERILKLARS